jgi:flagellar basal-body rod modification protein FlgD
MTVTSVAAPDNASLLSSLVSSSKTATASTEAELAANVANGSNSTASTTGNFSTFLKILTTQLQNQDPTSPMDTNQFTQQLVEFSGVEQQLNTNNLLQQLVNSSGGTGSVKSLLGYVGQYVEVPSTNQLLIQNGQADFGYTLPSVATTAAITIKDSTGATVATLSGPTTAGLNRITWDGKDASGTQLADGAYSVSIAATDSGGNNIPVTDTRIIGLVTGAQTADATTGNDLLLGSTFSVKDSTVDAVFSASSIPSATSTSSSGSSSSASTGS